MENMEKVEGRDDVCSVDLVSQAKGVVWHV